MHARTTRSGDLVDERSVVAAADAARRELGLAQHPAWWTLAEAAHARAVSELLAVDATAAELRQFAPETDSVGHDGVVVRGPWRRR